MSLSAVARSLPGTLRQEVVIEKLLALYEMLAAGIV